MNPVLRFSNTLFNFILQILGMKQLSIKPVNGKLRYFGSFFFKPYYLQSVGLNVNILKQDILQVIQCYQFIIRRCYFRN